MKLVIDIGESEIKDVTLHDLTLAVKDCMKYILQKKVGYVQINFFKGGITTTNVYETKKVNP